MILKTDWISVYALLERNIKHAKSPKLAKLASFLLPQLQKPPQTDIDWSKLP